MTDFPQLYRLQTQIDTLKETVERQGRTIDALIASLPQLSQQTPTAPTGTRSGSGGKVFREWVSWIDENGPAYRQEVMDGVGKPLPGNQPVLDWRSVMATWPDDAVPDDTLCKINGQSTGQGRPPTVYFLWKHRFGIYGAYGVGPAKRPEMEATKTETLLGVVHPPTGPATPVLSAETHGVHPMPSETYPRRVTLDPEPEAETPEHERFATMDEWNERWVPLFDSLAPYGEAPTAEEKAEMIATLPEDTGGEPWSTILARTSHEARLRSQS